MINQLRSALLLSSLFVLPTLYAEEPLQRKAPADVLLEYAIEAASLNIFITGESSGYVVGKRCTVCAEDRPVITKNTTIVANGKPVSLKQAEFRRGKPADIIYNIKTNEIRIISWID